LDGVGYFEPNKISPNCNALAKSIIPYHGVSTNPSVFLDSLLQCCLQTQKHAVTSLEHVYSITWY